MPPHLPVSQKTDKRAVAAFVVSVLSMLAALNEGARNAEYRGNVAEGTGANFVPFVIAVVAIGLAVSAIRRAPRSGQKGKGLAITAVVIGGLTIASCILHVVVLIGTTSG